MANFEDVLKDTIAKLAAPGKGLLAADESTGTIGKRFAGIQVENTEDNRRAYRELLFTAQAAWEQYICGVIMYEETLYQKAADGTPFVDILNKRGVVPGIKTDKGMTPMPGSPDEKITHGIDGLADRCKKYFEAGARFTKARSAFTVTDTLPSEAAILEQTRYQALYAKIVQDCGLVPVVEPEILVMEGSHGLQRSLEVTEHVLATQYKMLHDYGVKLEYTLLKPNMVLPGNDSADKASCTKEMVGAATLDVLRRTVPAAVPAIMFLSGGQSEAEATENLDAINRIDLSKPWKISFSYGRALQQSALKAWGGKAENKEAGQHAWVHRAKLNSDAVFGRYNPSEEGDENAKESLFQKNYTY